MAWTDAERTRVAAIEDVVNQLQTAINNLAAKQQIQQLLLIKQAEINDLTSRVQTLESMVALLQEAL